jgi:hypothetical protein
MSRNINSNTQQMRTVWQYSVCKQKRSYKGAVTNRNNNKNNNNKNNNQQEQEPTRTTNKNNNNAQHHGIITHLVLDLLHRLQLFNGKQQSSRRNKMRDIE